MSIYLKNEIMDILAYLTTLHYLKLYRMIQNFDEFRVYIKEFVYSIRFLLECGNSETLRKRSTLNVR